MPYADGGRGPLTPLARANPVAASSGGEASPSPDGGRGPLTPLARANPVAASGGGEASPSPDGGRGPLTPLVELWLRTVQPLGNYGFGKRSVWEGGVGLFMVSGAALLALALAWLRGFQLRSRFCRYSAVFEFSQAKRFRRAPARTAAAGSGQDGGGGGGLRFYLVALPVGVALGFRARRGVEGLLAGFIIGAASSLAVLVVVIARMDWKAEAGKARARAGVGAVGDEPCSGSGKEEAAPSGKV